jgi:hypothetical protein
VGLNVINLNLPRPLTGIESHQGSIIGLIRPFLRPATAK